MRTCQVLAVGPGARNRDGAIVPPAVKAGDRVLLPEYGGHAVRIGEEEYQLFSEQDILGKFQ
jgi:chaperonin GroES